MIDIHVKMIYEPYDFITVVISDDNGNIIDRLPVPKELDAEKIIKNRLKELKSELLHYE